MTDATLKLAPKLDLRAASELYDALKEKSGSDLTLDASEVNHMGALAVQVIRSAAKSWSEAGMSLSMSACSTDLSDQLALLGFAPDTLTTWETA